MPPIAKNWQLGPGPSHYKNLRPEICQTRRRTNLRADVVGYVALLPRRLRPRTATDLRERINQEQREEGRRIFTSECTLSNKVTPPWAVLQELLRWFHECWSTILRY